MKANDKAIEALADVLQHHGVFHGWFPKGLPADWRQLDPIGRREFLDIAGRLADAAFAAQFQSEDYADIIRALRVMHGTVLEKTEKQFRDGVKETMPSKAADALEALLAERDALKSELIDYKDAAASEADFVNEQAEKIRELKAERDALLARLEPVDDEALVEKAARTNYGKKWDDPENGPGEAMKGVWRNLYRKPLAAIRPHIEAAERERCAKIAETPELWLTDKPSRGCDDIAAAIRSGK